MFDIGSSEFLLIVIVAVIVIGPKDLPRALYKVGQVVGKARGMARHFRTGIDAMVREVELEELEKKWAAQNQRILDEHPAEPEAETAALPAPEPQHEPAPAAAEPASAVPGYGAAAASDPEAPKNGAQA
ncbi:MAG TPA: Sec-independent protein translocase protein TatB [Sphingobium sp.]